MSYDEVLIENAITRYTERAKVHPSRELSLTITKLEEALMWANKINWTQAVKEHV